MFFSVKVRIGSSSARPPVVRGSPVVNSSRFRRFRPGVERSLGAIGGVVLCVVVVVRVVVHVIVVVVLVAIVVLWLYWCVPVTVVVVVVVVGNGRRIPVHRGSRSVRSGPGTSHWNMVGCNCVCVVCCCDGLLVFGDLTRLDTKQEF